MAVLVVLAIAALAAGALIFRAQAEITASAAGGRSHQAYAAACSGLDQAIAVLKTYQQDSKVWYDNPDMFRARLVCNDGANKWYFTVFAESAAPAGGPAGQEAIRYGVTDESSRININTASAATLANLPNMTPELVDALLDWRDADNNPRQQGAEQEYYDRLSVPYMVRNGPLASLDELLMVRGFTAHTVYGEDYNLNGLLEKNEDDGDATFPPDNADGKLDRGLAGVATVYSYEKNVSSTGSLRININTAGKLPPAGPDGNSPGGRGRDRASADGGDAGGPDVAAAGDSGMADAGTDSGGTGADAPRSGRNRTARRDFGGQRRDFTGAARDNSAAAPTDAGDQPADEGAQRPRSGRDRIGASGRDGGGGSSGRDAGGARDFTGARDGGGNRLDRLRDRQPKTDNTADAAEATLSDQAAMYIGLYTADGNSIKHPSELLGASFKLKKDYGPLRAGTEIESGVTASDMAMLLDRYTGNSLPLAQGLVNVNTASVEVLAALPGMDADAARQVVERRAGLTAEQAATPAWLIEQDVLSQEQFKAVAPYLTTRGSQFRVRVVGYGWPCGQYRVLEAVVDVATGSPRVVYQRDLTGLGMPLSINVDQEVKR